MREYVEICWMAGIRKNMLECLEIDRNLQAYGGMCWNELERVIICGAIAETYGNAGIGGNALEICRHIKDRVG